MRAGIGALALFAALAAAPLATEAAGLPFDPGQFRFTAATGGHLAPLQEFNYTGLPAEQIRNTEFIAPTRNLKNALLHYRAWESGGRYVYTAQFWWTRNPDRLEGTNGMPVLYAQIAKYPDLAARYNAIAPTHVSWTLTGTLITPQHKARTAYVRVPAESVVMTASGKGENLPLIPQVAADIKRMLSHDLSHTRRWTAEDGSDERELRAALRESNRFGLLQHLSMVDLKVEWPLQEIDEIRRLFDQYEKGEREPSPLEELRQQTARLPPLPRAAPGDWWSEPVEIPVKIALDRDWNGSTVREGVIELKGRITGPKALLRQGVLKAEGYEQPFDIAEDGRFSRQVVLRSGANTIRVSAAGKHVDQRVTLDRPASKLRATLTWNTGNSDIDLHIADPQGRVASYRNKSIGGMTLDVDNTRGFGPENIYVPSTVPGRYTVKVQNFARGTGTEATVFVFVDEQLKDVHKVRFTSDKQMVTVGGYAF
jgi:hypothetical protein